MTDLHPELIAAIATRLYREAASAAAPAIRQPIVPNASVSDFRIAAERLLALAPPQTSLPDAPTLAPATASPSIPVNLIPTNGSSHIVKPDLGPHSVGMANPLMPRAGIPNVGTANMGAPNVGTPNMGTPSPSTPNMIAPGMAGTDIGNDPQDGLRGFVRRVRFSSAAAPADAVVRDVEFTRPCQSLSGDDALRRAVARLRSAHAVHTLPAAGNLPMLEQGFDVAGVRRDFPALHQTVHGKPLIWMDNAATTQKPQAVIDAVSRFYARDNSNIHRAAHTLAARATDAYERAREKSREFLGANASREILFVRGTTEGINLIANIFGRSQLREGDEILLTLLEHHANIVPWQMIARATGARIRVVPVNDRGEVLLAEYQRLLGPKTRMVGLVHACNSLGTILPVEEMTRMAKQHGARVLIDGAQSVAHIPVNVQTLGCDFYVFSGHKLFGPTGIGVVYATSELLDILPPWQGGGNMIRDVTFEHTTYADPPARFEAGTPNIADAVGLAAAIEYIQHLGLAAIARHEHDLLRQATEGLSAIPGLRLIGTAAHKVGVISFVLDNVPPEEVGKRLDHEGIAVRSGHHCAQPSLRRFGLEATVRPSLAFYNTPAEVEKLISVVRDIRH
jgi:cysteine desulfurase/selenocysteine lyase